MRAPPAVAAQKLIAAVAVATGPVNTVNHGRARGSHELSYQAAELAGRGRNNEPIGSIRPPQQGQ